MKCTPDSDAVLASCSYNDVGCPSDWYEYRACEGEAAKAGSRPPAPVVNGTGAGASPAPALEAGDRICRLCSRCGPGEYTATACSATADTDCRVGRRAAKET